MCVCVCAFVCVWKYTYYQVISSTFLGLFWCGELSISISPIFFTTASVHGGVMMSMKGLFCLEVLGVGDLKDLAGDPKIEEISGVGDVILLLLHVDCCRDSCACWKRKLQKLLVKSPNVYITYLSNFGQQKTYDQLQIHFKIMSWIQVDVIKGWKG